MNLPDDYQFTCNKCCHENMATWNTIANEKLCKLILQVIKQFEFCYSFIQSQLIITHKAVLTYCNMIIFIQC